MDERVQRVVDFIKRDLRRELRLNEVAQTVNLSSSRLRHIFKAETGMPPEQYLRSLRMQRARDLLESSFLSIKEIREQVGIGDRGSFVRDFKRAYGVTPAQYRARSAGGSAKRKTHTGFSGLLVLLIRDDQDTCEVLSMLLDHFGDRVTAVSSASDAQAAFALIRRDALNVNAGVSGKTHTGGAAR
jgi:AraC-like DNA-binding protein